MRPPIVADALDGTVAVYAWSRGDAYFDALIKIQQAALDPDVDRSGLAEVIRAAVDTAREQVMRSAGAESP